jgi:hypothetical protein
VLSLYWRVGLLFVLMGCPSSPEVAIPKSQDTSPASTPSAAPESRFKRRGHDDYDDDYDDYQAQSDQRPASTPRQAIQNQASPNQAQRENLRLYTAFLVGQYFSWTFILRRQVQFLKFSTGDKNTKLDKAFREIIVAFSFDDDPPNPLSKPFSLWRSQQWAIGELMTTDYGKEPVCIGYATFYRNWVRNRYGDSEDKVDETNENAQMNDMTAYEYCNGPFRQFFRPIIEGIIKVTTAKEKGGETVPDQRLRRLQHLFIDLINVLDDKHGRFKAKAKYCHRARHCPCENCKNRTCPCDDCDDDTNGEVNQEVGQPPFHNQTHDVEAASVTENNRLS